MLGRSAVTLHPDRPGFRGGRVRLPNCPDGVLAGAVRAYLGSADAAAPMTSRDFVLIPEFKLELPTNALQYH
jgi:hypothetical protein